MAERAPKRPPEQSEPVSLSLMPAEVLAARAAAFMAATQGPDKPKAYPSKAVA